MKKLFTILFFIFLIFVSCGRQKEIESKLYNVIVYNSKGEIFKTYNNLYWVYVTKNESWSSFDYILYFQKYIDSDILNNRYP